MCVIIRVLGVLGSGQFGSVHYGLWKYDNKHKNPVNVAVKMLQEKLSENDKVKFLQEAAIMGQFQHINVLKLHGIVQDTSVDEIVSISKFVF